MAIFLGLAAALTYGAADFLGGSASRRTDVFGVLVLSQVAGAALLVVLLPFLIEVEPTGTALLWGSAAGVAGGLGVAFFYKALALGRMTVVAPITGVEAAIIPVVFGLLRGERPAAIALVGVVLALLAVGLVSATPSPEPELDGDDVTGTPRPADERIALAFALAAGVGFGFFFIFLNEAGRDTGLWPLVSGRLTSLSVLAAGALLARRSLKPAPGTLGLIIGAGVFDVGANVFYLLATREGLLSLVAVLTSMYPAMTVLLARFVLNERLFPIQLAGLGVAGVGVTFIALG